MSLQREDSESPLHDSSMTFIVQHRGTCPSLVYIKADEQQISEKGRHEDVLLAALCAPLTHHIPAKTARSAHCSATPEK